MCILSQEYVPDYSPGEQAVQCATDNSAFA